MKEFIIERLTNLRKRMNEEKVDFYLIPTNDYHGSEYVGNYFKTREFISSFTGSAGFVIVSQEEAILWTDGRYFTQAENELKGTTIKLYKMGQPNVATINEYLRDSIDHKVIGFDGKCMSASFVNRLKKELNQLDFTIKADLDLVGDIWNDRPALSCTEAFILDDKYTGESINSKLRRLENKLKEEKADLHIISSLDDIAWLLNIRAEDVKCNPVLLSYFLYDHGNYILYCNKKALNKEVTKTLNDNGVLIKAYDEIYQDCKKLKGVVILDPSKVNYLLYQSLNDNRIIERMNITTEFKTIKNDVEIKNNYLAHLKDGVCVTKFIYWLKHNVGKIKMTEISCATYLENLRKEQENYKGLSFETISGYDYHGAIIHYDPTPETDIEVLPKSFLLVDSGAQYLEGTTDITRTISLGELSYEQKYHYTLVLKGHLQLGNAVFRKGTNGSALDMLARKPLWDQHLDYNHGTGHGVGQFLNVHEGPQRVGMGPNNYPFKKGMITSDEPGLYFVGKYGIRIENLMVCLDDCLNEYGEYLKFDFLTVAPYDKEAILPELLTFEEKEMLNKYNKRIYEELSPFLTKEEKVWLKDVTQEL